MTGAPRSGDLSVGNALMGVRGSSPFVPNGFKSFWLEQKVVSTPQTRETPHVFGHSG
jgi:hypothetical protein